MHNLKKLFTILIPYWLGFRTDHCTILTIMTIANTTDRKDYTAVYFSLVENIHYILYIRSITADQKSETGLGHVCVIGLKAASQNLPQKVFP